MLWLEFIQLIAGGMIYVYSQPLFWLVMALVALQYRRLRQTQLNMFGYCNFTLGRQLLHAAAFGTAGGFLGSFILAFAGVSVNQLGLGYIWPLAIALMFINMRFMCFAYAGGLVALANVLFGWPAVNVPQVLALVAGLHITESVLIYISGRYGAMPLILKQPDGRLVGAFSLQNFWPLPLVLTAAVVIPEANLPAQGLTMPDWWPLLPLNLDIPTGHTLMYGMLPVVAALGYSDMAVASTPAARRRRSAAHLLIYSMILLILALLSVRYGWLQFWAALLSPLGHEMLILIDRRRETSGLPLFVPPGRGVMILDTVASTPARRLGLQPGDVLLEIAGLRVNNGFELAGAISFAPAEFEVCFIRETNTFRRRGRFINGERRFGVILVPEGYETNYAEPADSRFGLAAWLARLRKRK